ncbi:MAG TPA: hypothetical protein VGA55_06210, partial [Bacteroidota bacterium]
MNTFSKRFFLVGVLACLVVATAFAQITSTGSGNWSSTTPDAPWPGGVVPGAADTVIVADGHTITVDGAAQCAMLTIGTTGTSNTTVRFAIDGSTGTLTVTGDILLAAANSRFRVESRNPAGTANSFVEHTLNLYGDLNNAAGGIVDFRGGSNASGTSNGVLLNLLGTSDATITLALSTYTSNTEEFNGITVNKSGGAKVILAGGNLFMSNNSTTGATILTFVDGVIETGTSTWVLLSTSSSGAVGASDTSYVLGKFGRAFSNSAGAVRDFPVGDLAGYRPITVGSTTSGSATGHHAVVSLEEGNANTGSSAFAGGIDRVSAYRYYNVTYFSGAGAASMDYNYFAPSYRDDDGVVSGNMDLRVAYSGNGRATWNGVPQTAPHTTDLTTPPTTIAPDSLVSAVTVTNGSAVLVALARATGTATNPLAAVSITRNVYSRYVGAVGSSATLQNPLAYYFTVENLLPNTAYDGLHMGFNGTSNTGSTRGSKWTPNGWVSPSTTVSPFGTTNAEGTLASWVALRPPSNFAAVDTYRVRIRIRQTGTADQITFDSDFDILTLEFDAAAAIRGGAVVHAFTDTVSQDLGGNIVLAYEVDTDVQPLAAWLIQRASDDSVELYTTRLDTIAKRGYFQLLVPANTPIGKLEVRDSGNAIIRMQTSSQWMSGAAGSTTNLDSQAEVLLVSVSRVSTVIPEDFAISQNYPNPFNP